MFNSERHDTYTRVRVATRDYDEQTRHKSDPMETGEMADQVDEEYDGEWEAAQALGHHTRHTHVQDVGCQSDIIKVPSWAPLGTC